MRLLLKASEEREDFYDLLGKEVTFDHDIISVGGSLLFEKGQKTFITDVTYTSGYWSNLCPDLYVKPEISMFKINGTAGHWRPETFTEFLKQSPKSK
jgi:hypothetical protein